MALNLPPVTAARSAGWKLALLYMAESLVRINQEIADCRACPRLVAWRERVAREKRRAYRDWEYWGRAVPSFGDLRARLLILGLAPAAHGANRTGRDRKSTRLNSSHT